MVLISIQPLHNQNHGGRYFPYSGYLGLTKLQVQGVVRTRIEDDRKLLAAHRVTVSIKCYEARTRLTHSRLNTLVDVTDVLWSASDPVTGCADIGDMDVPFRISLPANVAGYSTLSFPEYKIFWRLEAAIEHPPQFGLGSRQARVYDLGLTRYDVQKVPHLSIPHAPVDVPFNQRPSPPSHRYEPFYYRVQHPENPVGPGDDLPVTVSFTFPSSAIQSNPLNAISCVLERRLNLFEAAGSPTPSELIPTISTSTFSIYNPAVASSSTSLLPSYPIAHTSSRRSSDSPLAANVLLPSKSISSTIVFGATSKFESNSPTERVGTILLSLPAKPPPSQWPIGESLKTDLGEIKFELKLKASINTPSGPVEVSLDPQPIRLYPISQEQRSVARAKIAKKKEKLKAKSAPNSRRTSPAAARKSMPTGNMAMLKTKSTPGTAREGSSGRATGAAGRRASLNLARTDMKRLDTLTAEQDTLSTSGSSGGGPDTPLPKPSPNPSLMDVSYLDSSASATPRTASTFASFSASTSTHESNAPSISTSSSIYVSPSSSAFTSALSSLPAATQSAPSKPKSREDIGNGWSKPSRSLTLKRLPLISTNSPNVRPKASNARSPVSRSPTTDPCVPPRFPMDRSLFAVTTPTTLKGVSSTAVKAWEDELEKIATRSKIISDTMQTFRERAASNASVATARHTAASIAATPSTSSGGTEARMRKTPSASSSELSSPSSAERRSNRSVRGTKARNSTNALTPFGISLPSSPTSPPSFKIAGHHAPR